MKIRTVKLSEAIRRRFRKTFSGTAAIMARLRPLKCGNNRGLAIYFPKGKDHDAHTVRSIVHINSNKAGFRVTTRIKSRVLFVWKTED